MHGTLTESQARKLLADDETVASTVLCALHALFQDQWLVWEPESVWLELERQGCHISLGNTQQALAGRSLLTTGRFWYDALVYDATCSAFSNEVLSLDMPEDSLVAHLAWGVDEAAAICRDHGDDILDYDREVVEFTAHRLYDEGFVVAPQGLEFAQKALDRRYPKTEAHAELVAAVQGAYAELHKVASETREVPYPESARGVQLARLASVDAFLADRRKARAGC